MATPVGHASRATSTSSLLDRPVYGIGEAAGLLGLRTHRAPAWLDGYKRAGITHPPVVRAERTGDAVLTWGEFVELAYLTEYRRAGTRLQRLRPVIDELRHRFGTPHPLATQHPYLGGREQVLEIQQRHDLPSPLAIVVRRGQQTRPGEGARRFLNKVEFDPAQPFAASRLRPAGPASPVVIDPLVRFGRPSVGGVATERLWELADVNERVDDIAEAYEISLEETRAGIAYEEQLHSLAA